MEAPPGLVGTLPPQVGPHPIHFQGGQADVVAVAPGGPGYVAVGYIDPDIIATAWTSTDGLTWELAADMPAAEGSLAAAVAVGPAGIVAVGSAGSDAAAWRSDDGSHWVAAPDQKSLRDSTQLRMTAVVATDDGFVAAGFAGSQVGPNAAAFWRSPDGASWTRVDQGATFEGAQVNGLAAFDGLIVAVGGRGRIGQPSAAAAWVSDDGGATWREAGLPDAANAALFAVAAGPGGVAAVGDDAAAFRGVAWTSADGETWARSPDSEALANGSSRIELRAITWANDQYVAGGHRNFGTQRGTAVLWTSTDGRAWERAPEVPPLGGGKLFGLAAGAGRVIAVGSYGAPDLYVPTIWVSPPAP